MAKIIIPTPLRKFTNNQKDVQVKGQTVIEAINDLINEYPEIGNNILNDDGSIRNFVRVFLGDEDIQALKNEDTAIREDAVISIIPAIAGGIS